MPNGHRIVLHLDTRLRLTTLGGATLVSVEHDGPPIELFGPGKPLALLAYLTFSPRRTATREHLSDLLWGDVEPERAAHSLRQVVWQIRQTLGERALVTHNGELVLAIAFESDRDQFLTAIDAGALEEAVTRYTGDFLPNLAVPGGAEFEQWADLERVRLRAAFLRTADALTRRHLADGHVREAQRLARRARDTDSLNESGWRLLLEALIAGNDYVAATMEADALERLLQAEEREPEPATRAAIRLARQAPPDTAASRQQALTAELVGREKEFAGVVSAWDAARRGPGRHVHITAPAGLGKTRLLQDALARLRAGGARAAYLRANPGERHMASAFASDVAAAVAHLPGATGVTPAIASTLVALNPALSSTYSARPERRGGDEVLRNRGIAIAELLLAVAEEAPCCVLLDDLHWADPQSRQILAVAIGRVAPAKVLVVTASRPSADPVMGVAESATIRLQPLSVAQTDALVGSLAQLPNEPWARELAGRLHSSTGGSPLLIVESLQLALERDTLRIEDHTWSCPAPQQLARELAAGAALRHRIEQLDRTSQWILVTLAVAGTPLGAALLAHIAARPEEAIAQLVGSLEERGLVTRAGHDWEPAHDEIAAIALETATEDAIRAAHAGLGKELAARVSADPALATHAARHLSAGAEQSKLAEVTTTWVRDRRRHGDRRSSTELVAELLGEARSDPRVAALAHLLPWNIRLGLDTPSRLTAAALTMMMLMAAAGVALRRPSRLPPIASLLVMAETGQDSARVVRIDLRPEDLQPGGVIDVDRVGTPSATLRPGDFGGAPTPSPDGSKWVIARDFPDSGAVDLELLSQDGTRRRLTASRDDDGSPGFSPDGRQLVFSTGRWDPHSHYDLAVLDLATGNTRQLTHGDPTEISARWSPDGTRIGFVRRYFERRMSEVCWVAAGGGSDTCFPLDSMSMIETLGWRDPAHLLVEAHGSGSGVIGLVDPVARRMTVLTSGVVSAQASNDGRWIACQCDESRQGRAKWQILSTSHPEERTSLGMHGTPATDLIPFWVAPKTPPRFLDRVTIDAPAHVPLNATTRLRVTGVDSHSDEIAVPTLRWWVADSSLATVDSDGTLTPRRTGTIRVFASAGGWRDTAAAITIDSLDAPTVLAEDWSSGIDRAFVAYGSPRPTLVPGIAGAPAFWNNGDGAFNSGAISRATFESGRGLGMETRFSTPVTEQQWQYVAIQLISNIDTNAIAKWDRLTGSLPTTGGIVSGCSFGFPGGEGADSRTLATLGVGGVGRNIRLKATIANGSWHTVRLQLFPDGRCGVALDGVALAAMDGPLPLDRRYWLNIGGKSVGTRVLVGPVEVWEGVRGGVDWRLAPK